MDERTDREKRLDRFLNGLHFHMTDMQIAAFRNLSQYKFYDGSRLIMSQGPYEPNSWITVPANYRVNEFVKQKEEHMKADKGLYDKFSVTRNLNGEQVHGFFVLLPEKDPAAVAALATYADEVRKEAPELASDIHDWLERIHEGKMLTHPPIPDWAKDFFANGMRSTTNGSGQDLVLIEAGPGRGKTTLGIIAGIKYWESHATTPPTTGMGWIVTNNSSAPGSGFLHAQHLADVLVDKFHATVTCRHENIVSIPTKIGPCTIRICAIDSPVLEGLHLHADWLFFDNIDLMHPQIKVWRVTDRLDPKMLILSQSVHTFASSILANKNEWNVLTDPTLL